MQQEKLNWRDPPDIYDVRQAISDRAAVLGLLKAVKAELEYWEAYCTKEKPRTPHVRVLGVDDNSAKELSRLRQELLKYEIELARIDGELDFLNYRRDIFKSLSFYDRS